MWLVFDRIGFIFRIYWIFCFRKEYHFIYPLSILLLAAFTVLSNLRASALISYPYSLDYRAVYEPRIHLKGIRRTSYHMDSRMDFRGQILSKKLLHMTNNFSLYFIILFQLPHFGDLKNHSFAYLNLVLLPGWSTLTERTFVSDHWDN